MEYYSAFRKEILTHAAAWMNSEDIMLNEVSLSQKDKYFDSTHVGVLRSHQIQTDRKLEWWWARAGVSSGKQSGVI